MGGGNAVKIFPYWCQDTRKLAGKAVTTRAGSDESLDDARQKLERRFFYLRQLSCQGNSLSSKARAEITAFFADGLVGTDSYQQPICEELVKVLDSQNVITRNRYGALVLNSEDHVFLDVDFATKQQGPAFLNWLFNALAYNGKRDAATTRQKTIDRVLMATKASAFSHLRYRLYETRQGLRLVVAGATIPAQSEYMQKLCEVFGVDERYALLCRKQNCFRARLTPKPSRLRLAYPDGVRYPYSSADKAIMAAWVATYNVRCASYSVCRLLTEVNGPVTSPILDVHDQLCKLDKDFPLA